MDRGGLAAERAALDWPALIGGFVEASAEGPEAVARVALTAGRRVADADGAALVRWAGRRPRTVAAEGEAVELRWSRPADRVEVVDGRPTAAARVGEDGSLVVVRKAGGRPFERAVVEPLRAVGALVVWAGGEPRAALAALYEVARKVIGSLDLEEVLLTVANAASRLLRAEIAGVLLLDPASGELRMRCAVGHRSVGTARLRVRPGQGLAGKVLQTGRPERVDEYATDPSISKDFLTIATEEGTHSALCAPMQVRGTTEGVLCVWRRRRSVFADDEVHLMRALADLAAVAVERARLHGAQQAAAEQLARAHEELDRRYRAAERALAIHEELTQVAVEGSDVAEAVRRVRHLTGGRVALIGDDGTVVVEEPPGAGREILGPLGAELRQHPRAAPRSRVLTLARDRRVVVAPVRATGIGFGHLCVVLEEEPSPEDVVAAEQASTVCALLLAREEAAVAATRRLQSEFVWDLLEGRIPDEAEAVVRARRLGRTLELPVRVVLVAVGGLEDLVAESSGVEELERWRARIGRAVMERLGAASGARAVGARRADTIVALVPVPHGHPPEAARELAAAAAGAPRPQEVRLAVGVSGVARTVGDLPEAYRQAGFALSAASGGEQGAVVFDDLGVLRFLLAPAGRGDLERFAEEVLGPLLRYDRARGGSLVRTLEAYLEADCNLQRTARRLFVHHKTVRYRLQRIQELAGLDLGRQEDRFNAHLAVRIVRLGAQEAGARP